MNVKLTSKDLLKNIKLTKEKVAQLQEIDRQIAEAYKEPYSSLQKKTLAAMVNTAWLLGVTALGMAYPGYHLLIMPALYWVFRGSVVADRVSKAAYKRILDANEELIDCLYKQKADVEYELKTVTLLEEKMHNVALLESFERYIQEQKAVTIEKCMALYEAEQQKGNVKKNK